MSTGHSIPHANSLLHDVGQLKDYFKKIQNYPLLAADEEYELAEEWIKNQDSLAAEKLITSHLRLVTKVAAGYKGYGLSMPDLIAEGNIGLLHALKNFNPDKGARFSTYATWWIKALIQEYVLKSWSLVKMGTTSGQKKLFFNLKKLKNQLQPNQHSDALTDDSIHIIAEKLDVDEEEVREMEKRMWGSDASLNAQVSSQKNGLVEWQDWVESSEPNQEEQAIEQDQKKKQSHLLKDAFTLLNEREANILQMRRLKDPPETLETISKILHVSKERVRQIEEKAFEKLRAHMRSTAFSQGWAFAS